MEEKKEEKKRDQRKVTSIALRINWIRVWDLVGNYLAMDIGICLVIVGILLYGLDVQMTGAFSLDYSRSLVHSGPLRDWVYQVCDAEGALLYQWEAGPWLVWFRNGGVFVLIIQFLNVISLIINGTSQMRRQLKPLDEIALKAQELKELVEDEKNQIDILSRIGEIEGLLLDILT